MKGVFSNYVCKLYEMKVNKISLSMNKNFET
jgi:hypothetical protein